jgi:hypothetical protein
VPLFDYGQPATFRSEASYAITVVALEWRAHSVVRSGDAGEFRRFMANTTKGVYAFEAWLDSQGARSIVYVGKTDRTVGDRLADPRNSLQHVGDWLGDRFVLWSDVVDLTVRWAAVGDESFVEPVEQVLIAAHAPAFNSQLCRPDLRRNPQAESLVIMNVGDKGRLMPVVAGAYYSSNGSLWPPAT